MGQWGTLPTSLCSPVCPDFPWSSQTDCQDAAPGPGGASFAIPLPHVLPSARGVWRLQGVPVSDAGLSASQVSRCLGCRRHAGRGWCWLAGRRVTACTPVLADCPSGHCFPKLPWCLRVLVGSITRGQHSQLCAHQHHFKGLRTVLIVLLGVCLSRGPAWWAAPCRPPAAWPSPRKDA